MLFDMKGEEYQFWVNDDLAAPKPSKAAVGEWPAFHRKFYEEHNLAWPPSTADLQQHFSKFLAGRSVEDLPWA